MHFKLKLPPPAAPPGSSAGGGPLGTGLQFFCLAPNSLGDNAKRVCIWIPGLQPTDVVAWSVSNTFDGGSGAPFYENATGAESTDAALVIYTGFSGDTGSVTVTATVNGTDLDSITINFPSDCT